MLLNPYTTHVQTLPGTRILTETLGLIGAVIPDLYESSRRWTIISLYAPIAGRALSGIRAKLEDQKGFVTFCNQRDLEVLIGLAKPGDYCLWAREEYPEPRSRDFYGLCVDSEDLEDDLYDREILIRAELPGVLPNGIELTRRIHIDGPNVDVEEFDLFLDDCDPITGLGPDLRLDTVMSRWKRVERTRLNWVHL